MSLLIGSAGRNILNHMTAPNPSRMGRALNGSSQFIGKVLSPITFGNYHPKLTQVAFKLSQQLRENDVIRIESNKVTKDGQVLLHDEKLLKGIRAERILVDKKMCAPEGMASYFRWNIVGNIPKLISATILLLTNLSFAGTIAYATLLGNTIGSAFFCIMAVLSVITIPFHKIVLLFIPKKDRDSNINFALCNIDSLNPKILYFPKITTSKMRSQKHFIKLADGGVAPVLIPNTIFLKRPKTSDFPDEWILVL